MEERILEILKNAKQNALTKEEVFKKLAYTNLSFEDFEEVFDDMREKHFIYERKPGLYIENPFKEGVTILTKRGDLLVKSNGETYTIGENTLNCGTGDIVQIKITDPNEKRATLRSVIERKSHTAEVITEKGKRYALTRDGKKHKIILKPNVVDGMIIGIKYGQDKKTKEDVAILDKVIGHKNRPRIDEEMILYENNFNYEWSDEVLEEVKKLPYEVEEKDIIGRRDLRGKEIFTIDGADTKDIDDAISIEKLSNGNYKLGAHIADVSHYVKSGSAIFKEALSRATSVYLNTTVNPMLPPELSNGICSLNPEVDRLALTFDIEIDSKGRAVNFEVYESVIRSRKKMTYTDVNKILEEDEIPKGYEEYSETLKEMGVLAKILENERIKRGYQNYDLPEGKIITDENDKPIEITKRVQRSAEKLIEQFMLKANEEAATYIKNMGIPFVYRDHDLPNEEKLEKVLYIMEQYGDEVNIKGKIATPNFLQKLIKLIEDNPRKEVYTARILRCLAKADYREYNIGHFSIGIDSEKGKAYGHVTSPIRRLPDLMNHIILKKVIHHETEKLYEEQFRQKVAHIARHSSTQELNSDKCERESNKMKAAEYMENFINEEYEGTIIEFDNGKMYVQLPNLIEGCVIYKSMDDFYNYNENEETLVGEKTSKVYRLGDKVNIKVVRASKELREIDFEIEKPKSRVRKAI